MKASGIKKKNIYETFPKCLYIFNQKINWLVKSYRFPQLELE
jgi:hypothetical protein